MDRGSGAIYRFGPFRFDPSRRLLESGGVAVPVSSRGYDLLAVLLEERDRVLSRSEIMQRVWPGVTVEEHNLSVQVSKLRRALGDTGEEARVIATIPGRGYRFVAPIDDDAPPAAPPIVQPSRLEPPPPPPPPPTNRPGRWSARNASVALGTAALLAVAVGTTLLRETTRPPAPALSPPALSLVVMPLRDLSDRPGQSYLADAISDDLTTELAHLPGSTVIARETADSFRGRAVPATQIGRDLHVRYLLEGSIRSENDTLHVNAQLIDTATGAHVSAQKFDVPRTDPGLARDTIVRRIASALNVELIDAESARTRRDRPNDPTALDLFFQARSILDHDDTLAGFRAAQALLEHAVTLQPNFVDALAELSNALGRKLMSVDYPETEADAAHARALAARALRLSPRHPLALVARAQMLDFDGRTSEAAYAARDALEAEPSSLGALAIVARCAWDAGRLDEADQAFDTILRLNPNGSSNKPRLLILSYVRLIQGRYLEAIDLAQRATAGDPPPSSGVDSWGRAEGARTLLIAAHALAGQMQEARALYAEFVEIWPHRTVWRIGASANGPVARLPGFARFLGALHAAGMPLHADEHADEHVPPSAIPLRSDAFLPTPVTLPGAETIDTPAAAALKNRPSPPLVLDVGSGAAVMPGAVVRSQSEQAEDDNAFVDNALKHARPGAGASIVITGDGTYGSGSYNAALHLVSLGLRHVLWYRGGEEAWAESGAPCEDHRQ